MRLKNKFILITAGPTWVSIDRVRVLSNIASGETGIALAEKLARSGAKITLLLGPVGKYEAVNKFRILRFKFFDELKNQLFHELKHRKYDVVIHSAAVSDYRPTRVLPGKAKSNLQHWRIGLVPTAKLIERVKKINRNIFLVGFKFEPDKPKKMLINSARRLIKSADADLVIANTLSRSRYKAYILGKNKDYGLLTSKHTMVDRLSKIISEL